MLLLRCRNVTVSAKQDRFTGHCQSGIDNPKASFASCIYSFPDVITIPSTLKDIILSRRVRNTQTVSLYTTKDRTFYSQMIIEVQ